MHNDSLLEVSENTLIPKPLIVSQYRFVFLENLGFSFGFGFLTVTETETALFYKQFHHFHKVLRYDY